MRVIQTGNLTLDLRSMCLLERLGFSPASPEQHVKHRVEPGELLMLREIEHI
jgi:hypothetical protein